MNSIEKLEKLYHLGKRAFQRAIFLSLSDEFRLVEPFTKLRRRFYKNYWNTVANSINAEIESVGYDIYRLTRKGRTTFVRNGEVMLDDHLTLNIAGNKPLVHKLLMEEGFTVPDYLEYEASNNNDAVKLVQSEGTYFVVKPASSTSAGNGITTKINSVRRLNKASARASIFSNKLIIEKEIKGLSYRLLYLDGIFLDAICRDSPSVTGDGKSTVKELIKFENRKRLSAEPAVALSPLTIDLDCRYTLMDRGFSIDHVPKDGERFVIKTAANQYSRCENHSVRDTIHPEIIEYGRKLSQVINVTLSGVDVMMTDCTVPLDKSGCVVNEINTTPGLHHHALISCPENEVPVGAIVIEHIFNT